MTAWVVTSQGKEESPTGTILRVYVRCWGVYSTEARAQVIAAKHSATVTEMTVDQEQGANLEVWLNPGYAQD